MSERELVNIGQDAGFAVERIPLSGATGGSFGGDLRWPLLGKDLRVEVKCGANRFASVYNYLEGNDALIVKADRRPHLVIMSLKDALEIARFAEAAFKQASAA